MLVIAALANAALWTYYIVHFGIHTDLASYLTFTYLGLHSGWPHLYDWQMTKPLVHIYGAPYWPN